MKTKIGTEVAHVTRESDTTFKVKRSRSPGRFTHRRAAVSVGTYWPWETTAKLRLLGGTRRFGAHRGRRGAGHIVAAVRLQLVVPQPPIGGGIKR